MKYGLSKCNFPHTYYSNITNILKHRLTRESKLKYLIIDLYYKRNINNKKLAFYIIDFGLLTNPFLQIYKILMKYTVNNSLVVS